jgi:hypothetical protein
VAWIGEAGQAWFGTAGSGMARLGDVWRGRRDEVRHGEERNGLERRGRRGGARQGMESAGHG